MSRIHRILIGTGLIIALAGADGALAAAEGRLVATGGVVTIEGSAGGGIVPMAVMAGLSTRRGWDWVAGAAHLTVSDFRLDSIGIAASVNDRFEMSLAEQRLGIDFDLPSALPRSVRQRIIGAKLRLAGDLIYGPMPQISAGLQWKKNGDFALARALGADDDSGLDAYFSVTRLVLDGPFNRNWLFNGTLRATRANETGLLGFGRAGDSDGYRVVGEASTAVFFNPRWAMGLEYRQKPEFLDAVGESDWRDIFVGWFPNPRINVVLAYADLGDVAGRADQDGFFLSVTGNLP